MDQQGTIKELLHALESLVGMDGYLTQHDICECDNTHTQNNTVCRICWARLMYEKHWVRQAVSDWTEYTAREE